MNVQAFLKTPLYRGAFGEDRSDKLGGHVVEVHGSAEVRDGGLDVLVSALYDDRGKPVDAPFQRIFVPLSKIDYYVIAV